MEFRPMSPEEMQRTMQFLLSQQAKHDARIELIDEKLIEIEEKIVRVTDAIAGLTGFMGHVVGHLEQQVEGMARLTVRMDQLAEAQLRTDDHLNVLVQMFERHLREDHGSRPS